MKQTLIVEELKHSIFQSICQQKPSVVSTISTALQAKEFDQLLIKYSFLKLNYPAFVQCLVFQRQQDGALGAFHPTIDVDTMRHTALLFSLIHYVRIREPLFDFYGFWQHSFGVGVIGMLIAGNADPLVLRNVFWAGVFHDIGKYVLASYFPHIYGQLFSITQETRFLWKDMEDLMFGFTHADVGAWFARHWGFPTCTIDCISHHHSPELFTNYHRQIQIIHAADILCRSIHIGNPGDQKIPSIHPDVFQGLGFSELSLELLYLQIDFYLQDIENISRSFNAIAADWIR